MSDETTMNGAEVKADVVDAYQELLHKLKVSRKPAPTEVEVRNEDGEIEEVIIQEGNVITDTTALQEARIHEEEAKIETLSQETSEEYTRHIENLKYSIGDMLDEVKQKVQAENRKLTELMTAIQNRTRKIEEVHNIEVNIDSLSALMLAQKEKTHLFEEEMREKRQQFEQELAHKRRERQQEEMKYIYQRDLQREKEQNQYEMQRRQTEQELAEMRERAESELAERERQLGSREELNKQIADFPEELRQAVQNAKDTTTRQLTNNFEYEKQILEKELRLREQTIETLEAKIETLEVNIKHFDSLKKSFNRLLTNQLDLQDAPV